MLVRAPSFLPNPPGPTRILSSLPQPCDRTHPQALSGSSKAKRGVPRSPGAPEPPGSQSKVEQGTTLNCSCLYGSREFCFPPQHSTPSPRLSPLAPSSPCLAGGREWGEHIWFPRENWNRGRIKPQHTPIPTASLLATPFRS